MFNATNMIVKKYFVIETFKFYINFCPRKKNSRLGYDISKSFCNIFVEIWQYYSKVRFLYQVSNKGKSYQDGWIAAFNNINSKYYFKISSWCHWKVNKIFFTVFISNVNMELYFVKIFLNLEISLYATKFFPN